MACCGFCVTPIGNHSRHLHAKCAGIYRGRVARTTREYRLYVPLRTIKREQDLLAQYDAEQKAKEVPADGPRPSHSQKPATGSAPVAGLGTTKENPQ